MQTRSFLLAALVAALLLSIAAVPAGAAGPGTPRTWGSNTSGSSAAAARPTASAPAR
jgi:hypothetical protein